MKKIHALLCSNCDFIISLYPNFTQTCTCGQSYAMLKDNETVEYAGDYAFVIFLQNEKFVPLSENEGAYKVSRLPNQQVDFVKSVLDYLNDKAGTRYSDKGANYQLVIMRKREFKCSLDDFYQIIDNKVKEWRGTDMEKYLRPATLFNKTKFANYLGQKDAIHRKETKDIGGLINTAESAKRSISEGRRNSGGSGSGSEND